MHADFLTFNSLCFHSKNLNQYLFIPVWFKKKELTEDFSFDFILLLSLLLDCALPLDGGGGKKALTRLSLLD